MGLDEEQFETALKDVQIQISLVLGLVRSHKSPYNITSPQPSPTDMSPIHGRSLSPDVTSKRAKIIHAEKMEVDQAAHFTPGLFDHNVTSNLHQAYISNKPFKYAIIEKLVQDDLLTNVKDECLRELSFTEKETDIYKVSMALPSCYFLIERHNRSIKRGTSRPSTI